MTGTSQSRTCNYRSLQPITIPNCAVENSCVTYYILVRFAGEAFYSHCCSHYSCQPIAMFNVQSPSFFLLMQITRFAKEKMNQARYDGERLIR